MISAYDIIADEYYDPFHKTCRNFDETTILAVRDIKRSIPKNGLVLDIGSGRGRTAEFLNIDPKRVIQLDNSKMMLELEPRECCLIRIHNHAEALPFLGSQFSCVTAFLCDAYLGMNFLSEVYRVLQKDGIFVATNPSFKWASALRREISLELGLTRYKTKSGKEIRVPSIVIPNEQLSEMLRVAGFEDTSFKIEDHCLPTESKIVSTDIEISARKLNVNVYEIPILTSVVAFKK
jgi:SAM-dependent methyltransferase